MQLSSASTNSAPTSVVAVFDARSTRLDELTAIAAALPERSAVLAVVLT